MIPGVGGHPKNVVFLTADAFGVLPPVSKLTPEQAMFHFMSGYTAKVAGTEAGVTEPQATFSTCFGAPFMPLPPKVYAEMLGRRLREHNAQCWLVNTGWQGGPYGVGKRMSLPYTRAMVNALVEGALNDVEFEIEPAFGLSIPDVRSGSAGRAAEAAQFVERQGSLRQDGGRSVGAVREELRAVRRTARDQGSGSAGRSREVARFVPPCRTSPEWHGVDRAILCLLSPMTTDHPTGLTAISALCVSSPSYRWFSRL